MKNALGSLDKRAVVAGAAHQAHQGPRQQLKIN